MDWFDRQILQFVLQWAPHGVLHDEDTFPKFGMNVEQLIVRFSQIVSAPVTTGLPEADRELLHAARQYERFLPSANVGSPIVADDADIAEGA